MAVNPERGEAEIDIGGETRVLRLDFNAIAQLEEMHGRAVMEIFAAKALGVRVIRDAIYVGLCAGAVDPADAARLSPRIVGEWMQKEPGRFAEWGHAVKVALLRAMGKADPKEAKKKPPLVESDPTGSTGMS